jgi:hypothetical protein
MRRARIVRIEWDIVETWGAELENGSIEYALSLTWGQSMKRITVTGEPSFTVDERTKPMPDALFGPKSFKKDGE